VATGNWQLATGNWQLATGNWQLATGNLERMMTTWRLLTTTWFLEPSILCGCAALLVAYAYLARPRTAGRSALYASGVLVLLLSLISPIDTLGDGYLFSAHMLQYQQQVLIAPPLLLLGIPPTTWTALLAWSPARRAEPPRALVPGMPGYHRVPGLDEPAAAGLEPAAAREDPTADLLAGDRRPGHYPDILGHDQHYFSGGNRGYLPDYRHNRLGVGADV